MLADSLVINFCYYFVRVSGVVEFLTSGRVNANHRDFKEIGYDDCLCKLSFTSDAKDIYTHGFRLAQAYGREILPFTNYTYVSLCAVNIIRTCWACTCLKIMAIIDFVCWQWKCIIVLSVCNFGVLWPNSWTDQDEAWHAGNPRPWPQC